MILPDDCDCRSFAIGGGKVTSLDSRRVSCSGATAVVRALYRGASHRTDAVGAGHRTDAVMVGRWQYLTANGLTLCAPGRRWIQAHYKLD